MVQNLRKARPHLRLKTPYNTTDDDNNKADCDDDVDGGGGNSNDDGSVYGDGIFENWCVDGEGGDETDDGDEQTVSVAGGVA